MFMASVAVDDCDNRAAERAKFFDLRMNEPLMMAMMGGMFVGPENTPSEAFDGHLRAMLINALTGLAPRGHPRRLAFTMFEPRVFGPGSWRRRAGQV